MTNDTIEHLIDSLNAGEMSDRVYISTLTPKVDFARAWLDQRAGATPDRHSYEFYLIRGSAGSYVGAVLDMVYDLHVFVKPTHRKKGHLCTALDETILPRLLQRGRTVQTLSFVNPEVASYFVRRLGFQITPEGPGNGSIHAQKDLSVYATLPPIEPIYLGLSQSGFDAAELRIKEAKRLLNMVKEQLEAAYGSLDSLIIEGLIEDLADLPYDIRELMQTKGPEEQTAE